MKENNNCKKDLKEAKEKINEANEEIVSCEKEKSSIEKELQESKKKEQEYYDQLLRLKAEFENYRKRIEKEKHEIANWARYDFIQHIIPLYEMMKMASAHISNSSSLDDIKKGLEMIFLEFEKLFKAEGVSEIDILNKKCDPMLCETIATVDGDGSNDDIVVEVVQPGYMVNGRLLKPAKVKVAKKKEIKESKENVEKPEEKTQEENKSK